MQEGDEEALSLWKWFCDISMKEFNRIYDRLGITFDSYAGESFYNDKMGAVVEEIKEKNLLTESQGAQIVDLEEYNMPPCLILRSDGGTLYPTRDISAAIYRKKTYDFEKCIYVTALDQNLHFAQWFKVIDLMGYDWADKLVHVPFGLVSLVGEKLSTRNGHVVLMEDTLNSAVEKTLAIINEKNPNLENKEQTSEEVGIGAVIFNDLYNSRIKNVVFDLQRMLNFEGETGPYVQYTHARACSIIERATDVTVDGNIDYSLICDEASVNVCKALNELNGKIVDAADKNEPYIVTRHLIEICKAFNKFYNENNIMNSEGELKKARLAIVVAVRNTIAAGLELIGIKAPQKM
jgi:arginyl-tRNA synthetase